MSRSSVEVRYVNWPSDDDGLSFGRRPPDDDELLWRSRLPLEMPFVSRPPDDELPFWRWPDEHDELVQVFFIRSVSVGNTYS